MNKKLQSVVQSKYFYLVMSALIAIAIWIIALNTSNPVVETTMDVSVIYLNESLPAEKNLSRMSELGLTTATVKVSGRRNTINNLLPSELKVYVDFADVNTIGVAHLKVSKPECDRIGVKILDYYPKEIDVSYDKKDERYLEVKTEYTNEVLAEGFEFISVTTEPASIPISGFASDIKDLDHIKVSISGDVEKGTINSNRTISLLGRYITTSGHDVTADFNTEKFTVKIEVAKRVPVKYTISGTPGKDYYVIKNDISFGTVLLQGDTDAVTKLSQIDLGTIDINGITEDYSRSVNLSDYIPSGTTVYGDSMRVVTVDIGKYVTKKVELSINDISQPGKNDSEFAYDISFADALAPVDNKIMVTIKGKAADVENMTVSSLKPVLDLSEMNIGSYRNQRIVFDVPKDVVVIGEYTVNIDVSVAGVTETPSETIGSPNPTETVTPDVSPTPEGPVETVAPI